ncbi:MAG: response regulator [Bacteroidales bacterium]|nr:response regulator [Bacteroidales bacterium]
MKLKKQMELLINKTPKILIIDDNISVVGFISEILVSHGAKVMSALDGKKGLVKAKANNFDLIILDVMMEGLNGIEVCKKLKKDNTTNNIPVIFITVRDDDKTIIEAFNAGGVDYITKPIRKHEFLARVRTHLNLKEINMQLVLEKEKAVVANKFKDSFLANMSHEIRTPMNSIVGFSELLQMPDINKQMIDDYTKIIISNSEYLLKILNDIIEISKIDAGAVEIEYINCSPNKLFNEIFVSFENQIIRIEKTNLKLIIDIPDENVNTIISTDPTRLRQIISNLIGNAIKFTDKGYVKFGYKIVSENSEQPMLNIFVEDTGVGIEKNKIENIFDRFVQADKTINRDFGGAGLGLSITRGLIKLLGGGIRVESEFGKGTAFYINLPFVEKEKEKEKAIEENNNNEHHFWKGKTILIADDVKMVCVFLKTILKSTQIKMLFAEDGNKTLEIYEKHKNEIDLVLLDLIMPGLNGFEIAKTIRQQDRKLPIIAQTAVALSTTRKQALEAGCNKCIFKPLKINELFDILEEYLDK